MIPSVANIQVASFPDIFHHEHDDVMNYVTLYDKSFYDNNFSVILL